MQKRCTHSDCRAAIPGKALYCPQCGRSTGRHDPKKPAVTWQGRTDREIAIDGALRWVEDSPLECVELSPDFFVALRSGVLIRCVKALKEANGSMSLKEAKDISKVLLRGKEWT
ncbi:hypothetical protein LJC74_03335 [Eubacteriales bacterium OttesenSCG-928-A19]|nr:hypothetical protein [Eubacteriales bacterium OttesenSCG-928-A19]